MNIIVTGASRGIGYEIVKELLNTGGHSIIAIARDYGRLSLLKTFEKKGDHASCVYPLAFDLVNGNYKNDLLPFMLNIFNKVDILVNNAGYLVKKEFGIFDESDFNTLFDTNVKSVLKLSQLLISYFSTNAHIVNLGSMGGFQGSIKFPGLSLYSSSKAALAVMSECMAEELKSRNIKVNCLCIGAAETEMFIEAFPEYKAPLSANEISKFIADFALKAHYYINGKILPVSLSTP